MVRKINQNLAELFDQKQQNLFCDVTLVATADGTGIRAHRNVLHTASEFFKGLLTTEMEESNLAEIRMDRVSGAVLRQLIDYAYTQHIDIDASNVEDILAAADFFLLDGVVEMCEGVYLQWIDATSVFHILAIAGKYRLVDLEQSARDFAHVHFIEIVEGEAFVGLEAEALVGYLGRDEIQINSEEDVFNAIARWIEAAPQDRKQHYGALMNTVRMSRIDYNFLNIRILEWSREVNMPYVFMDACAEKSRQDLKVTDEERDADFKYMFVVGELENSAGLQIERYSPGSNSWEDVERIAGISSAQIHCIENCLYLLDNDGGYTVMLMPLATMELEILKPIKNRRHKFASVAVGQYVFCIGGMARGILLRSVERYDTKSDEWLDIGMLNQGRYYAEATVLAGQIYVVGGYNNGGLKSVERYDPATNLWTNVAELNAARYGHLCRPIKGFIYAVGGWMADPYGPPSSIEKYDAQLDQWTIIEHGEPSDSYGILSIGNWIYIVENNKNGEEYSNVVRKFNVRDGRSKELPSMNHQMSDVYATLAR